MLLKRKELALVKEPLKRNYITASIRRFSSKKGFVYKEKIKDLPAPAYNPSVAEVGKYEKWENSGVFTANVEENGRKTYSMILPPPNITGNLHLGHALATTLQDVVVRYRRMLGNDVLWLPGTDHAGIATQAVVEKYLLKKTGTDRHALGRERLQDEVWKWKSLHGNTILNQLKRLGSSLDWSRQVFTMDQTQSAAVIEAFVRLFEKGLVYRENSLVNWCCQLRSTLSDIEVENMSIDGPRDVKIPSYNKPVKFGLMTNFAYKMDNGKEEIVVSTTRPETLLGDTAIAVNPYDSRYKHFVGRKAYHPFREEYIPIIADEFVDSAFGTGAVKITPAHNRNDYAVSKRHNIPMLQVINEDGNVMLPLKGFQNLNRYDCRNFVIEKLKDFGMFRSQLPHAMNLPICSRTGDVIELLPKEQWFISCKTLAAKGIKAVNDGFLNIEPSFYIRPWINWLEVEKDWCISRQLWWGHQIPAYKCWKHDDVQNYKWIAARNKDEALTKATEHLDCMKELIKCEQDEDVLDTWFSSGIYPFTALGWPYTTPELKKYYPLSIMMTGHDILFFWVYRMVILGLELTEKLPFNKILLHGIICDSHGAKMSKSRGNVIDPRDLISGISLVELDKKSEVQLENGILNKQELEKAKQYHKAHFPNGIPECGVDALRFTLCSKNVKTRYITFDVNDCHTNKLFCNKLWQAVKYLQSSCDKLPESFSVKDCGNLTDFDRWILSRVAYLVESVNISIANHDFHLATKNLKTFLYNEICDVYLETTKPGFLTSDINNSKAVIHAYTLSTALTIGLRCLSPFMIYITQELLPRIPFFEQNYLLPNTDHSDDVFPKHENWAKWRDTELENNINSFLKHIKIFRQLRNAFKLPPKYPFHVHVNCESNDFVKFFNENCDIFKFISRANEVTFGKILYTPYIISVLVNPDSVLSIILPEKEETAQTLKNGLANLKKKENKVLKSLSKLEMIVSGEKYDNAPEDVKVSNEFKLSNLKEELEQIRKLMGNMN